MNNQIENIVLPQVIQNILENIFSECKINDLLEEDFWVAGGFPRIIHLCLKKSDAEISNFLKQYLQNYSDIDVFTSSKEKALKAYQRNLNILSNDNSKKTWQYASPFASNLHLNVYPITRRTSFVSIQFVTEFLYNNIKETFDSFDFSNVKFAIKKDKGLYNLYYTEEAEHYNNRNILNIERVASPFLSCRLNKYIEKYNLDFNDNQKNRDFISEYIHKLFKNDWPDAFKSCTFNVELFVKTINKLVGLSNLDLCLFLGKYSHIENVGKYGLYTCTKINDWAAYELNKKND